MRVSARRQSSTSPAGEPRVRVSASHRHSSRAMERAFVKDRGLIHSVSYSPTMESGAWHTVQPSRTDGAARTPLALTPFGCAHLTTNPYNTLDRFVILYICLTGGLLMACDLQEAGICGFSREKICTIIVPYYSTLSHHRISNSRR